jgi:hypothetical protein
MGNGLFNPPPPITNGTTLPDIPVPDFVATGQAVATGVKQADLWTSLWRKCWASVIEGLHKLIVILAGGMDDLIAAYLGVIGGFKGTNQPGFFNLIATVLSGQLGVSVSYDTIQAAFNSSGSVPAMRTIGGNVFQAWAQITAPGSGAALSGPGVASAEGFMGWLIEYAIKHGNTAVLSTLIPEEWRVFEGVAEYGHAISQALGLGRLSRLALQPLIRTLIAEPLQIDLNRTYTPKLLSESQYVRAFVRGEIDGAALQLALAQLGYNQALQTTLINENTKAAGVKELVDFYRATGQGSSTPPATLQVLGYDSAGANVVWTAALEALIDPLRKQELAVLTNQLRTGEIDLATAQSILSTMNLFPQEQGWYQQIWSQILSFPRKRLSESEVEKAFLEGLIDMTTVQNYWIQSGYGSDSIQVLTLLLLQRLQGGTKTTAGHTPHRHLTTAELGKALKAGTMTTAQVQAYLAQLGYSAADIQVLIQQL